MNMEKEIPVLYLDFDEEDMGGGMSVLSFVSKPATEIKWEVFQEVKDTYNDYPIAASNNACRAIKYKEDNGSDCGTQVGWVRASQLCSKRPISVETISRMASFKRHQQNKNTPYDEGCGKIMWDCWGGDEGIDWAIRKMEKINNGMSKLPFSRQEFQSINDEKRLVTAPVMLAETPIARFSPEIGKYYVKFSKETIVKMMRKYFKENKIHLINTDHNSTQKKDGVYMMESFIVGDRTESKLFPELTEGSWIATYYVENDEVWESIKSGEYQGFSLEGFFIEKYENEMFDKIETQLREIVYSNDTDEVKEQKIKVLLKIK